MAEEKITPEQQKAIDEARAKARGYALKNLGKGSSVVDLGVSYIANQGNAYGDSGDSAVDQYLYRTALDKGAKFYDESGSEIGLISNSLLGTREDGERYTGSITEKKIIKQAAAIMQASLGQVKVSDVLELMGSKIKVKPEYADKYVADVAEVKLSEVIEGLDDKAKKQYEKVSLANYLVGEYTSFITDSKVGEALSLRAKATTSGLEKILQAPEKEK